MKRSEIVEHFKDVRVRGTDVLAVPLNETDMVIPPEEKNSVGFKSETKEVKPEEPIRFLAVAVGPGCLVYGKLIPLIGIKPGDVFLSSVQNKSIREDWKERPRVLCGYRIALFEAWADNGEGGAIPMVLENVPEVE